VRSSATSPGRLDGPGVAEAAHPEWLLERRRRQLNRALHDIVLTRWRICPRTPIAARIDSVSDYAAAAGLGSDSRRPERRRTASVQHRP
jgi:hypothetical protein